MRFFMLAAALVLGCQAAQRRDGVSGGDERIPGVAELRAEEWRVLITHDPQSGIALLVNDAPAVGADLRIGDRFKITDGTVLVEYQLLSIGEDAARFRQRAWAALRSDPGVQTHQTVITVGTYPERRPPEVTQ